MHSSQLLLPHYEFYTTPNQPDGVPHVPSNQHSKQNPIHIADGGLNTTLTNVQHNDS